MSFNPITGPVFSIYGGQEFDGESGWRQAINQSLIKIDAVISLSVTNANQAQNPTNPSPGPGSRYIVAVGATGAFAGHDRQVAVYTYSANGTLGWQFYAPIDGLVAYETSTTYTWVYQSSTTSWIPKPAIAENFIIPNVGTMGGSTITVTGGSPNQVVDTISKLTFSSAKYTVQTKYTANGTSNYLVTELLVTSDGTIAQCTEYAKLISNLDLGTFSAAISGNNIQLRFSPLNNSGTMTLRIMRTAIYI